MKNKKIHDSVLELIGNTPMVRLNRICKGLQSEILVKLEYMNPSGSLKDRIAVTMIEQAEKEGKIKPGYTIIESSTGNTGFGLSSVGKLKGYKVCIYETMPGKAGAEKTKMMHNVGAEVRLMEPKDLQGLKERSVAGSEVELPGRMLCLEDERANPDKIWWARQFANRANVDAHHVTAREILEQTDGKVDVFIQSIGTGGSLMGVAEVLKKECPKVKVIGIQPASSKELWHPGHGRVKTRLATATSPNHAAAMARAFLLDLIERLSAIAARCVLAFAPPEAAPLFADLMGDRFALIPQSDGDLGRRLSVFFHEQMSAGAESVVVLGTDSPTLPPAFIEQAFVALQQADVVLGPATDGGYYLVGCARRVPPIFEGITWGGPTVLAETIARLADPAWRLAVLPPWYDVDTGDDWQMLRGHLAALRRAGLDPGLPHTERLCREDSR